ncbi:MAG: diguanylate cyclase [Bacilli bacterium]|nr:diguanylate cyclase [Bacilli bacterium]
MHSLRTRTALLNVIAIIVSVTVAAIIAAISFANFGHRSAELEISLTCETGKSNINYYLKSVEQSVTIVSDLIDSDLDALTDEEYTTNLGSHVERAKRLFYETAINTNGALTYYYRFDLSVTAETNEKGFWFANLDDKGFLEHEVTDLSDDKNECVWFYTPKETGKPMWLPPYDTDNLDVYVISYNVPVYRNNAFVGVVGIEIDYMTLGEQINQLKAFKSGFAYIVKNSDASIVYHPTIDILKMKPEDRPTVPEHFREEFFKGEHHIVYTFEGVEKHSYWLELSNGMSIVVCAPSMEINSTWLNVIGRITIVAVGLIAIFVVISIFFSRRMTQPLKELTLAAEEIDKGNYKVELNYHGNDEIGTLTHAFNKLVKNLDEYIGELNDLAYADALTSVKNKQAFDVAMEELQKRIDNKEEVKFALAMFDCDNLKDINDEYGHDKGDIYLRNACHLICRVFKGSPVYRFGGDEFFALLQGNDYKIRRSLTDLFVKRADEINQFAKEPWETICVSVGVATYDPDVDKSVKDVIVHADHLMYTDKRDRKKHKHD